jgi:hypothetical protein
VHAGAEMRTGPEEEEEESYLIIYESICQCLFDIMILEHGYEQDQIPTMLATS